jgi:translocation protein SEC66
MLSRRYEIVDPIPRAKLTFQANAFAPGWGQIIFQSASEMAQNTQLRERLNEILSTAPAEKTWWDERKATIQSDFMKELDDEKTEKAAELAAKAPGKVGSDDDAVIVESGGPADKAGKGSKKKKGKH